LEAVRERIGPKVSESFFMLKKALSIVENSRAIRNRQRMADALGKSYFIVTMLYDVTDFLRSNPSSAQQLAKPVKSPHICIATIRKKFLLGAGANQSRA
jgi:hypothetical protein